MSAHKLNKADVVTDFRRAQVIAAARERFSKHGLAGTTMDGIAQAAGVAKGTVYLYYKSKEDIFRQILDEDLTQLQDDTVPLISGDGDIEHKLRGFFRGVLGFFDRKKDFCELAIFEMGPDVRKKAMQRFEIVFRAQVEAWQTLLDEAQRSGLIDMADARASANIIVGAASGMAKQRLRGWETGPVEDVATQAARTLWKGLAAR
ncbi:MAG: TetR/AcrR family transcriptional regulator [Vicinamibacteraceae bacterium]